MIIIAVLVAVLDDSGGIGVRFSRTNYIILMFIVTIKCPVSHFFLTLLFP